MTTPTSSGPPDAAARNGREWRELGSRAARALTEAAGPGHGRTLLVGLSGGADSAALLFLLTDTQARHGWRLRAAHIDHGIQEPAIREQFRAAATGAARRARVPLEIAEADAPAELSGGGGIEAAARRARYRALAEIAEQRRAELVAVAHTLDDQAETVLLHILRGSGIDGLAAMPPIGNMPETDSGLQLARPLLGHRRSETHRVCVLHGFGAVEDPANRDLSRTRNRLRHEALPLLRTFNPQVDTALSELAESARGDRELLDGLTQQALTEATPGSDDSLVLDRRALLACAPALQARMLRALAGRLGLRLTAERTRAGLGATRSGRGVVEFGGGVRLRVVRGRVILSDLEEPPPDAPMLI